MSSEGNTGTGSANLDLYDDMHRLILQGMMAAGMLDAEGVKKLFVSACYYFHLSHEERTSMSYVQKVMLNINDKIKPYDMAIRRASCELTGKKYYLFLITVEKPIIKLQCLYSPFEVGLLQKVIEMVFRKYPSFTAPFIECVNLSTEVEPKGNIDQGEKFLRQMLKTNYLIAFPLEGNDFNITIGIRGLRELESLLRDCYGDCLENCVLCKTSLLHGLLCPDCRIAIHKHCYIRFFKSLKGVSAVLCPSCKGSWDTRSRMLVRMRDEDEEYAPGQSPEDDQTQAGGNAGQSPNDDRDDVDMPTLSRMTIRSKNKSKSKSRKRQQVSSESEESD